jgi:hypothetical protein
MYPGQTHCAACRHPLSDPVQQTQHGLMHGACAHQLTMGKPTWWTWVVVATLVLLMGVAAVVGGR